MDTQALLTGFAVARELIGAGSDLLANIDTRQRQREADGTELTAADLVELFREGDTQQRVERALLMKLQAEQQESKGG